MAASENEVKRPECVPNDECALSAGLRTAFLDERIESDRFTARSFSRTCPKPGRRCMPSLKRN